MIKAAVVDDNAEVRGLLATALGRGRDLVVSQYPCRRLVELSELSSGDAPEVVVFRVARADPDGALAGCRWLREHVPSARALAVTGATAEGSVLAAFAAGVRGVVAAGGASLPDAVRVVATGGTFIDPQLAGGLVALALRGQRETGPFGLSLQELRVLERLPRGLTNREIGHELAISEHTVKSHMRSILHKLDASDRSEAATIALRHGLA